MKMPRLRDCVLRFLREEEGPTAVEYAVMLALIAAAVVGSVGLVSQATVESLDESADAISGAFGG